MSEKLILPAVVAIGTIWGIGWGIFVLYLSRRKQQLEALQQSFEHLQQINQIALQSPENLRAILQSANPEQAFNEDAARELFFHYMRINRFFRVYEYWKAGFIPVEQRDRVVRCHVGVLKPIRDKLKSMSKRGYPEDFVDYLINEIDMSDEVPTIYS